MDEATKKHILSLSREAHDLTDSALQKNSSTRCEPGWPAKQRILLADMALHLLQTSLKDGELCAEGLKRNLYSILTVSEQFLPGYGLKVSADKLYDQ